MRIIDKYENDNATFFTVELEENVFVDVKCIGDLCYVMDCADGYNTHDSNGNTFDYHYSENDVVDFIRGQIKE